MFLSLTVISVVAAAALSSVYMLTMKPIEDATAKKTEEAIQNVLPSFDKIELVTAPNGMQIYKASTANGEFIGAAVEAKSDKGFGGEIKIMVGFDKDGAIVNYAVLSQQETPGLGTKMTDWFKPQEKTKKSLVERLFGFEVKAAARKSSIIGKNPSNLLRVKNDGGEIDAITASTISSRAFLEAVNAAYATYAAENGLTVADVDTETGATVNEAKAEEAKVKVKAEAKAEAETGATKSDDEAKAEAESGATISNEDVKTEAKKAETEAGTIQNNGEQ